MKKIFLLTILIATAVSSCKIIDRKREKGNGNIRKEDRSVSAFREVEVHGAINLYVSQGDLKPIQIETDENLIPYVEIIQEGDKIIVRNRDSYDLDPSEDVKVHVSAPAYESIDVSGACNIIGQTKINNPDDLKLNVSGAGEIKMEVDAPKIGVRVSGSGKVILEGETREFNLKISGAGTAECYKLLSEHTSVEISGAGNAEVFASDKLEAKISGAGTVNYKGGAKNVNQQVSGAGTVRKVE